MSYQPARLWRVARCTEPGCGRVDEGNTRSVYADVDPLSLHDPAIGNIHTCKWCEWLAENPIPVTKEDNHG